MPSKTSKGKGKKTNTKEKNEKLEGNKTDEFPNEATRKANLYLNVKRTQKWLKKYYERYTTEKKNEKGELEKHPIKLIKSYHVLTASDQTLCLKLINLEESTSKKSINGLYNITEEQLINDVKINKDFKYTFGKFLDAYETHEDYFSQLEYDSKQFNKFIETFAFSGGNSNIHLNKQAFNFLSFIILKARIMIVETAYQMIRFANKSSVNDNAILYSVNTIFIGDLLQAIHKKIEDVSNLLKGTIIDKDNEENEPTKEEKSKTNKMDNKNKHIKNSKKNNIESDDEDNSSDSESESEE